MLIAYGSVHSTLWAFPGYQLPVQLTKFVMFLATPSLFLVYVNPFVVDSSCNKRSHPSSIQIASLTLFQNSNSLVHHKQLNIEHKECLP